MLVAFWFSAVPQRLSCSLVEAGTKRGIWPGLERLVEQMAQLRRQIGRQERFLNEQRAW